MIYDGITQVELPNDSKYHFTTDMTKLAISWVRYWQALTPDKPFFIYFALGATHAPHHVPIEWADKYKGKFDQGWDAVRQHTLDRQKKLGVVPAITTLATKPSDIKDRDKLSADEQNFYMRLSPQALLNKNDRTT